MKLFMSLSVLIIGFLISTSLLNTISTQALLDTNENQYNIDSFDRSAWKWSTTEVVSTESTDWSGYVSLAVDSPGNVHVVWKDLTNYAGAGTDEDIFYKRWDTASSSWTMSEVVSTESTDWSGYASLAVDSSGNVHIAWVDDTDYAGSGTDTDIFYKYWNASSSAWTTTEVVSTESTDSGVSSSLVVDSSGNVHIAWGDGTDYAGAGKDPDIFYKSTTSELETELASLQGFVVLTSLILGTYIFFFTVTRTRKKKSKPN
ncbi:hypothetical protein ES705_24601 [subsurface metagenome]